MKKILIDTLAMVALSLVVGFFLEYLVSGLNLHLSGVVRGIVIVGTIASGYPYALYRRWLFRKLNAIDHNRFKKGVTDTMAMVSANVLVHVPFYGFLLYYFGVEWVRNLAANGLSVIIAFFIGYPYGLLLDFLYKFFRIPISEKKPLS